MNTVADPLNIERATIDGAVYLPLALLKPSPTNPRKRFDPIHLQELADSVRKHGVIQPILARAIAGAGTPKRPPTNTMKRLVSMRLMTEALKPFMGIQVMEYSVPAAVRQAWVAWKAEQAQEKVS